MHPLRHAALAAALGIALIGTQASAQAPAHARQRVIVQVSDNDPAKWNLALNNVRNMQADLGAGNVDVELVAYGPGISMLKMDSQVAPRIEEALRSGVRVVACENTMRGQKLKRDDMLSDIGYVKAGVVEIIQRQNEGYAYLRP
jgi:intracellular sulfur oxidation DsrE/DsrF family protein